MAWVRSRSPVPEEWQRGESHLSTWDSSEPPRQISPRAYWRDSTKDSGMGRTQRKTTIRNNRIQEPKTHHGPRSENTRSKTRYWNSREASPRVTIISGDNGSS